MQFLAIYGTKAEAIFPLWTLRPSWFSWPSLRRGGGGGEKKREKRIKWRRKKGQEGKWEQELQETAPELLSHRAWLGGDVGGTESSLGMMLQTVGHVSSQHPEPRSPSIPNILWGWAQITEEGVHGEKPLAS